MWAVAWTAFLMGLLGGAHCLVMCAAPCGAVVGAGAESSGPQEQVVRFMPRRRVGWRPVLFHLGRILGYAAVGAMAAYAMEKLAWFSQNSSSLRPIWTALHIAIIAWGLMMIMNLSQPQWMERAGRKIWSRIQPVLQRPGGVWAVGCGWVFLPCGFLYSALLLAALSGGPTAGAVTMVMFGLSSGLWLVAGGWAWSLVRQRMRAHATLAEWGTRLSGMVLVGLGGTALWWGVVHQEAAPWCLP
ncbi:sulfite exporter TauE/SafE family protein [Diaphorobacter sp.]|uniref:sulfite exporter TauE/SafE family protein n=1 Tax=Diaphorobacter sp. TaxID=1934310 RepID=UPI0028A6FA65|nr:sulfite exporter TauE/SafE family protein [Diaphorobacter sp.]